MTATITATPTAVICHGEEWTLQHDSSGIGHCWHDVELQGQELLDYAIEWPNSHEGQAVSSLMDPEEETEFQIGANHYRWV